MPSSVRVGSRPPSSCLIFSYSSGVRPCSRMTRGEIGRVRRSSHRGTSIVAFAAAGEKSRRCEVRQFRLARRLHYTVPRHEVRSSSAPPGTSITAKPRWSRRSPALTPTAWRKRSAAASPSTSVSPTGVASPSGETLRLGFVDVPGHERFVRNMLAGVGGIDLVLLVIAADESIKPQTREHFDICRLLGVRAASPC